MRNAIANDYGIDLVLVPEPPDAVIRDSCNEPAEFAMDNDVLTENDLFLLDSTCQTHKVKGLPLHLKGDFENLIANPVTKERYMAETKEKLARIHQIHSDEIILVSFRKGSVITDWLFPSEVANADNSDAGNNVYIGKLGNHLVSHEGHPAFKHIRSIQGALIQLGTEISGTMANARRTRREDECRVIHLLDLFALE
jgi:hypothetical protein